MERYESELKAKIYDLLESYHDSCEVIMGLMTQTRGDSEISMTDLNFIFSAYDELVELNSLIKQYNKNFKDGIINNIEKIFQENLKELKSGLIGLLTNE